MLLFRFGRALGPLAAASPHQKEYSEPPVKRWKENGRARRIPPKKRLSAPLAQAGASAL